ncbi:MAG: cell envelope integrity protein CreD [Hyphomicrobiaceae bacterium]
MGLVDAIRGLMRSPAFKFVVIIILILALAIPLLFVYLMVKERAQYAASAKAEIGRAWGGEQSLRGPFIMVPTVRERSVRVRNETRTEKIREFAIFLPEKLNIKPVARTELRRRGIFEVPVYRSEIAFTGHFVPPAMRKVARPGTEFLWSEAVLALLISDVRGIKKTAEIKLGDTAAVKFRSGLGLETGSRGRPLGAIHVPIEESAAKQGFTYAFKLDLNGSSALNFVPAGGETEVTAQSDWPHPSFQGNFLPDSRTITDKGFEATWKIPRLARGQSQTLHVRNPAGLMGTTEFGVNFFQPVKFYSLAERALKYAQGFLAIVFFAVFVLEMQARRRVHWIQYLFVGLALVIFYLVLIGTAEHIGFEAGYFAASAATSLLVGTYIGTVTRSFSRGAQILAVIAIIYALLYLLLRVEDYALLIGSIAAFVMLAAVMFATRDIDWSGKQTPVEEEPAMGDR